MLASLPPVLAWGLVLGSVGLLSYWVTLDALWLRRSGASGLGIAAGFAVEAIVPLAVLTAFVLALPVPLLVAVPASAAMFEPSWPMRMSWGQSPHLQVLWAVLEVDRLASSQNLDVGRVQEVHAQLERLRDGEVTGLIDLTGQQIVLVSAATWNPADPVCSALARRINEEVTALYGERSARLLRALRVPGPEP